VGLGLEIQKACLQRAFIHAERVWLYTCVLRAPELRGIDPGNRQAPCASIPCAQGVAQQQAVYQHARRRPAMYVMYTSSSFFILSFAQVVQQETIFCPIERAKTSYYCTKLLSPDANRRV
jgi:hypothetical protein